MTTHDDRRNVLHWYDFLCPFCYVGQQRTGLLMASGLDIVQLPFQAHADIPPGGIRAGLRIGPMYAQLALEAESAGLPLRWPPRLPNTRRSLAAAEWARRYHPLEFLQFHGELFAAHFALGEDLEDPTVIDRHARAAGLDVAMLNAALADDRAFDAVTEAEIRGRASGVNGTPAWLVGKHLIIGLRPAAYFERVAAAIVGLAQ